MWSNRPASSCRFWEKIIITTRKYRMLTMANMVFYYGDTFGRVDRGVTLCIAHEASLPHACHCYHLYNQCYTIVLSVCVTLSLMLSCASLNLCVHAYLCLFLHVFSLCFYPVLKYRHRNLLLLYYVPNMWAPTRFWMGWKRRGNLYFTPGRDSWGRRV